MRVNTGAGRRPRGIALGKLAGKAARGVSAFWQAVAAGSDAASLAERYYAMNDAQLACIGLSRDRIPRELLRVLSR